MSNLFGASPVGEDLPDVEARPHHDQGVRQVVARTASAPPEIAGVIGHPLEKRPRLAAFRRT
jgi:hypothetical protein